MDNAYRYRGRADSRKTGISYKRIIASILAHFAGENVLGAVRALVFIGAVIFTVVIACAIEAGAVGAFGGIAAAAAVCALAYLVIKRDGREE